VWLLLVEEEVCGDGASRVVLVWVFFYYLAIGVC
jgi:hypothetical protein